MDKKHTYGLIMSAIREHGIQKVRNTVFQKDSQREAIAIEMYINSRMHREDITKRVESI